MLFGQIWMGASAQHLVKSEPVEEGNHCLSHASCKTTLTTASVQYAPRAALKSQGRILRYASRGISYESYTWYDAFTELRKLDIDPINLPSLFHEVAYHLSCRPSDVIGDGHPGPKRMAERGL
jgi:hypothetical protein